MADYDEDLINAIRKADAETLSNPDDFETWEKVIKATENPETPLNRNSSPQAISLVRDVYDRFLAKFPLFYGYWKKYADVEFTIAGTESAEYIYERGVASVGASIDMWTNYCTFKAETCHNPEVVRELFERAIECVGLDYYAHHIYDKYIEFETRIEARDRIFPILSRLVHLPMHQYARYFERIRRDAHSRPIPELASEDVLQRLNAEVMAEAQMQLSPGDFDAALRAKVDQYYAEIFQRTQKATTERWTYEGNIKRTYFHVTEVEEDELDNFNKYLDFEEAAGDYSRITFLYEKCLIVTANYPEIWQRYARYMYAQPNKVEEVRIILARASYFFVPIAQPAVRMHWALFEEANGHADTAGEILDGILVAMPHHIPALVRLANLQLRQSGKDAAIAVYQQHLYSDATSSTTKGSIVSELARMIYQTTNDDAEARAVFEQNRGLCVDSEAFWGGWMDFEMHQQMRQSAHLSPESIRSLSQWYMDFLTERGGSTAAVEWLDFDALVNGSSVTGTLLASKGAIGPGESKVNGKH